MRLLFTNSVTKAKSTITPSVMPTISSINVKPFGLAPGRGRMAVKRFVDVMVLEARVRST
jgi:hypothetical protein